MRTSAWRLVVYALIILAGVMTALPNLLTQRQLDALPDWLPKEQVTLGLDLRGGAHLVLEIDTQALANEGSADPNARLASAVEQSLEIVRMRLDESGLAEPSLQRVGANRILVQVPGVQDAKRIEDLLVTTAKMTFHLVRDVDMTRPPPGVVARKSS